MEQNNQTRTANIFSKAVNNFIVQFIGLVAFSFLILFIFLSLANKPALSDEMPTQSKGTIVFIPGFGFKPQNYQSLINNFQDEQYQVITYTPDDSPTDDYVATIKKWNTEISDMVGDRKVIVIGHAGGGAVATHFCSTDHRCIAGINLDGGKRHEDLLSVPFLYIQADPGAYCDDQCYKDRAVMETITKASHTQMIHITGIKQDNFTDVRTPELSKEDYLGAKDGRDEITNAIDDFLEKLPAQK